MAAIDKRPSGKWRVRWRTHPGANQQSRSFDLKADADAFRRQVERELDDGLAITASDRRLTVGEYVTRPDSWLDSRSWRSSSRDLFASHWRRHLEPRWGKVVLGAVRPTDVQGWVNGLERSGLAPATVKALYQRLVAILRAAHADGLIARQPISGIVLPESPTAGRVHVPTLEQVEAMAGAVGDRYKALVWTGATLGLRPGEAIGLTVERVDFLQGVATIDRQVVTPNQGVPRFGPLKTKRMPSREVPVPAGLIERLAAHLERYPAIELEAPDSLGGTGKLIFANADGRPIRRGGLGHVWTKAAKRVDLPAELKGWHSLRHFAITRLISAGVNPDYVRQFAGHSTLTETLNRYSGWWPSDADEAREALTAALGGLTQSAPALRSV